jgi:phosphatidylglycerophosphatase A
MITSVNVTFKELLKRPACLLAYGFGSGLAPKAPGTMGTIAAIPLYLLIQDLALLPYLLILVLAFMAGIWFCQKAVDWLGQEDPSAVVWDEFVGYWVTMIAAPAGWQWLVVGFVLFRFFDILKPWPISWCDKKLHGGFGIMLDDVIAGIFAFICMQLLYFYING